MASVSLGPCRSSFLQQRCCLRFLSSHAPLPILPTLAPCYVLAKREHFSLHTPLPLMAESCTARFLSAYLLFVVAVLVHCLFIRLLLHFCFVEPELFFRPICSSSWSCSCTV
jgi:hypothetical protein